MNWSQRLRINAILRRKQWLVIVKMFNTSNIVSELEICDQVEDVDPVHHIPAVVHMARPWYMCVPKAFLSLMPNGSTRPSPSDYARHCGEELPFVCEGLNITIAEAQPIGPHPQGKPCEASAISFRDKVWHTHTYVCTHTYINTYTHTHIHSCKRKKRKDEKIYINKKASTILFPSCLILFMPPS